MRHAALFLALTMVPSMNLGAQESALLESGVRVRVSTATQPSRPQWIIGTFVSATSDRLTISTGTDGGELQIPRPAVTRLQVSRGQRSNARRGFALGFFVGAGAGAAIGYAALGDGFDLSPGNAALVGAAAGALAGGLIGLAIGSGERWQDITHMAASEARFRQPISLSVNSPHHAP